jgi:hypothetical protein
VDERVGRGTGDAPEVAPRRPPPTPPLTPTPTPGGTNVPIPKPAGITQVSGSSWTITEALADDWRAAPTSVARLREVPGGWQIVAAKTRPAYHLGLRSGDVIVSANGHALATRAQLLMAWMDLRNDEVFTLVLLRDGVQRTHTYRIVSR